MRKGSGRGEHGLNKRRLGAEGWQVGIQRRGAAGVEEQHVGALGEVSLAGQIAGMVNKEQTAKEIIEEIFTQAEDVLKGATKWVK